MSFDDREPTTTAIPSTDVGTPGSDLYDTTGFSFPDHDVDTAKLIKAANKIQNNLSGEPLPEYVLPGFGEETDTCGDDFPNFCDECGDPVIIGRTCRRSVCPRCSPAWARKTAARIGAKISGLGAYETVVQGEDMFYHHIVLSPPDDLLVDADDADDVRRTVREALKEIATELGMRGGYWFYHPYRTDAGPEGEDDRGVWKQLLFEGLEWDDAREDLSFEPHFHLIGVGNHVAGGDVTRQFYNETGWVYKRITQGGDDSHSNVSLYGDYELAKALTYTLSHIGLYEQGDSMRGAFNRFGEHIDNVTTEDYPELKNQWEQLTRQVAVETLGLPYQSMVCQNDVECDDPDHDHGDVDDRSRGSASVDDRYDGEVRGLGNADPRLGSGGGLPPSRRGMPTAGAGELPNARSSTDFVFGAGDVPNIHNMPAARLQALRTMGKEELIESWDDLDDENVYRFMDALEDVEPADVCGGNLRPIQDAPRYLVDEDWRDGAEFVEDLVDTVQEFREEWREDPPHTPAKLLLRNLRDHASRLPFEALDPGG